MVGGLRDEKIKSVRSDERSEVECGHYASAERNHAPAAHDDGLAEFLLEMPGKILLHFHRPPLQEFLVCDLRGFLNRIEKFGIGGICRSLFPFYIPEFTLLPASERRLRRSGEVCDRDRKLSVMVAREMDAYDTLGESRALQFGNEPRHKLLDVCPPYERMVGDPRPCVLRRIGRRFLLPLRAGSVHDGAVRTQPLFGRMLVGVLGICIAAKSQEENRLRRTAHEILHAAHRSSAVETVGGPKADAAMAHAETDVHDLKVNP